jgi:phosphohistidine phosphatase
VKRLWLLRHAKSSWDDPGLSDEDRPLAERGERAAEQMRSYLASHNVRPALVLCSSAVRARTTLARVLPALGTDLEIRIEYWLYTFADAVVLARVRGVPDDVDGVLVVGHNPALQDLAVRLAGGGDDLDAMAEKFPTGALAEITFVVPTWVAIADASGELTRFVRPRDLTA